MNFVLYFSDVSRGNHIYFSLRGTQPLVQRVFFFCYLPVNCIFYGIFLLMHAVHKSRRWRRYVLYSLLCTVPMYGRTGGLYFYHKNPLCSYFPQQCPFNRWHLLLYRCAVHNFQLLFVFKLIFDLIIIYSCSCGNSIGHSAKRNATKRTLSNHGHSI